MSNAKDLNKLPSGQDSATEQSIPTVDQPTAATSSEITNASNKVAGSANKIVANQDDTGTQLTPEQPTDAHDETDNRRLLFPAQKYNDYAQIATHFGIDETQYANTTEEISKSYATSLATVLKHGIDGISMAQIAELEKDKKKNKFYVAKFKAYIKSQLDGVSDDKAFKRFVRKVGSAKKMTELVKIWNSAVGKPNEQEINLAFGQAFAALLYGQGYMAPDRVSRYLEKAEGRDAKNTRIKLLPLLDKMLGEGKGRLPDQNSDQSQAIAGQILSNAILAAEADPRVNIAAIFEKVVAASPEATSMDPLVKESLDFILGFRKVVEAKVGNSELVEIDQEAAEKRTTARIETVAKINDQIAKKNDTIAELEAKITKNEDETSRLSNEIERLNPLVSAAGPNSKEALQREDLMKKREALSGNYRQIYERISRLRSETESLEKKLESVQANNAQTEEREFETNKKNLVANLELVNHVTRLSAYISERVEQLKKSGVTVDFDQMPTLRELLELAKNPEALKKQDFARAMMNFFTDSRVIALDRELRAVKDVLTEKRPYTPMEASLAVLTEIYKVKYNCTADTANFMAATNYVRMQKEHNLREFRRKLDTERANSKLKGIDKYPIDDMIKRIVRDEAKDSISPSEAITLEALSDKMSLAEIRKTLAEGSVSIDSINFLVYNLLSTIAPKKCNDGSMVTLKTAADVAAAESLVDKLNRVASEYAGLTAMQNAKNIAKKDPSKFGVFALTEGLKAYQEQFDQNETNILIAAKHHESYMFTRAKSKAVLKELLITAKNEKWSKAKFEEEKSLRGLTDLPEQGNARFRAGQGINLTRDTAKRIRTEVTDFGRSVWTNKGKIGKYATAPLWGPPYLLYKAAEKTVKGTVNLSKAVVRKAINATYVVPAVGTTVAMGAAAPIIYPFKGVIDGFKNVKNNIAPANSQQLADSTMAAINKHAIVTPKKDKNDDDDETIKDKAA